MRWLLVCVALAGCARAGKENVIIGGITDAGPRRDAAEALPDAGVDAPTVPTVAAAPGTGGLPPDGVTPASD